MTIADDVSHAVAQYAPLAEQLAVALASAYGAGPAVSMAIKLVAGAAAKLPEAVSLVEQIQAGTIPTQAELDAYAADEDSSYSKLMKDIAAARAAT